MPDQLITGIPDFSGIQSPQLPPGQPEQQSPRFDVLPPVDLPHASELVRVQESLHRTETKTLSARGLTVGVGESSPVVGVIEYDTFNPDTGRYDKRYISANAVVMLSDGVTVVFGSRSHSNGVLEKNDGLPRDKSDDFRNSYSAERCLFVLSTMSANGKPKLTTDKEPISPIDDLLRSAKSDEITVAGIRVKKGNDENLSIRSEYQDAEILAAKQKPANRVSNILRRINEATLGSDRLTKNGLRTRRMIGGLAAMGTLLVPALNANTQIKEVKAAAKWANPTELVADAAAKINENDPAARARVAKVLDMIENNDTAAIKAMASEAIASGDYITDAVLKDANNSISSASTIEQLKDAGNKFLNNYGKTLNIEASPADIPRLKNALNDVVDGMGMMPLDDNGVKSFSNIIFKHDEAKYKEARAHIDSNSTKYGNHAITYNIDNWQPKSGSTLVHEATHGDIEQDQAIFEKAFEKVFDRKKDMEQRQEAKDNVAEGKLGITHQFDKSNKLSAELAIATNMEAAKPGSLAVMVSRAGYEKTQNPYATTSTLRGILQSLPSLAFAVYAGIPRRTKGERDRRKHNQA